MSSSWVINGVGLTYDSITPIKMLDTDILNLKDNVMMYSSSKSALMDVLKNMNDTTVKGELADLYKLEPLKWEDATLWTFIQSKMAIVSAPLVFFAIIPPMKYIVKRNLKKSQTLNPEWWI